MLKNTKSLVLIVLITLIKPVFGQEKIETSVNSSISKNEHLFDEKLYVHTDRDSYLTGEIIWFKIYITDAFTHQPANLSDMAYLEILDVQNNSIKELKIQIKKGSGNGSIFLPQSLNSGTYHLRAYTRWMKNFDPEFYFVKKIEIINPLKIIIANKQEKDNKLDIQFFPEGGNLVAGIESKIGFKGVNQQGMGVDFSGTLLNNKNEVVAQFKPLKFGMGSFNLKPEKSQNYRVIVNYKGSREDKSFIAVNDSGYSLNLNESDTTKIEVLAQNQEVKNKPVYLVVSQRQSTILTNVKELNGIVKFTILKNKLADGISTFTLFDKNMTPVAERLYFKYPKDRLNLFIHPDKNNYLTREKVSLTLEAKDENKNPVSSNLSISVFLDDSSKHQQSNIYSYLWLSADIRGDVENPNYYFDTENTDRSLALENLLLTQGWRRFNVKKDRNQNTKIPLFDPEYHQNIITAKITNKLTGKPASDVNCYLSVKGDVNHFYGSKSNGEGLLKFYVQPIYGPVEFNLQTQNLEDNIYNFEIQSQFDENKSSHLTGLDKSSPTYNLHWLNRNLSMQVQNTYNYKKLSEFINPILERPFYGNASDKKYNLDNYVRFPTMEEVFREYVKEIFVKKDNKKFSLTIYNVEDKKYMSFPPLIMLDGVPMKSEDKWMQYDPLKIKTLDIVAKNYYLGPLIFGGILNFSSYINNAKVTDIDPNINFIDYQGLELQREFYSPIYQTEKEINSHLPDFRSLLYWSGDIQTSLSGKQNISFYTSDLKGKYIVLVQGLSSLGKAGNETISFEVGK